MGAYLIGFLLIIILFFRLKPREDLIAIHSDIHTPKDIYIIGSSYFMASISLAIGAYGESLVVRTIGSTTDVALYFKSLVLFLFPGVMFNQYIAAVVGPLLRQNEKRAVSLLRKYRVFMLAALCAVWPGLIITGYILGSLLYDEHFTPLALAALLSLTSCVRCPYVPAHVLGAGESGSRCNLCRCHCQSH